MTDNFDFETWSADFEVCRNLERRVTDAEEYFNELEGRIGPIRKIAPQDVETQGDEARATYSEAQNEYISHANALVAAVEKNRPVLHVTVYADRRVELELQGAKKLDDNIFNLLYLGAMDPSAPRLHIGQFDFISNFYSGHRFRTARSDLLVLTPPTDSDNQNTIAQQTYVRISRRRRGHVLVFEQDVPNYPLQERLREERKLTEEQIERNMKASLQLYEQHYQATIEVIGKLADSSGMLRFKFEYHTSSQ